MSIENNGIKNENFKNKQSLDDDLLEEEKKQIDFKKQKEKIELEINSEIELDNLKILIEKGFINNDTAQKILSGEKISNSEIIEIFEKINQIEKIKDIDKYLPKEYRITQEQYLKAINDDIYRVKILTKLDFALNILVKQIIPDSSSGLNLFSSIIGILDKNLILIQENTIDIKTGLKKVDKQKSSKQNIRLSFWQKIINFIKKLFN